MPDPVEVLGQLLSPQQASSLDSAGRRVWASASATLGTLQGAPPSFSGIDGSLVMPDEIAATFASPHLAIPLELSTDQDQSATAYLVLETAPTAAFLESQADNADDEEQQTIVIASTLLGQVVQALNASVFGLSPAGLIIAIDDVTANTMSALLKAMDDPCLLLQGTLAGAREIPLSLVLPGTFLDILAGAMDGVGEGPRDAQPSEPAPFSFDLTQEELEAAELLDVNTSPPPPPEPVFASAPAEAFATPSREPTPIGPAAARARFAPIAETIPPQTHQAIDLLAGLQMNVTVELGRTALTVSEVLGLGPGAVIELDRLAGEPVDILVNERLIARGEVVVVDENFGIRVVEVIRRGAERDERTG